jgi:head-tail adaptor
VIAQDRKERIVIERLPESRGATGALKRDEHLWVSIGERWARAVPRQTQRFERLMAQYDMVTVVYECLGGLDVAPRDRVRHAGRTYEVIGVQTRDNRPPADADELTLVCKGLQ